MSDYTCSCGATFRTRGGIERHGKPFPASHRLSGQSKCGRQQPRSVQRKSEQRWNAAEHRWGR